MSLENVNKLSLPTHQPRQLKLETYTSSIASDNISAPSRESTNTKIGGVKYFESLSKAKSLFFFDLSSTQRITCFTSIFGALGAPTEIQTGFTVKRVDEILSTDGGMVAENKSVCLVAEMFFRID
jgi:hypothetical protein